MSAIANFYLFAESDLNALIDNPPAPATAPVASPAQKPGFWKNLFAAGQSQSPAVSPEDLFWDAFIDTGKELEPYDYSGYTFLHLKLLLDGRGVDWEEFANKEVGQRLDEKIGDSTAFGATGAAALLQRLSALTVSRADLESYAAAEFGDDQGAMVEAMESAFDKLKGWLAQVKPGAIGVFRYG